MHAHRRRRNIIYEFIINEMAQALKRQGDTNKRTQDGRRVQRRENVKPIEERTM